MGRDGHDNAGAVMDQDVIGYPELGFFAGERVDHVTTGKNTVFFSFRCAFQVGFFRCFPDIIFNRFFLFGGG